MTEENKDLIKRDLSIIKKLHQKTEYTNPDNIKVIYNYVLSKELLKTHLGQKYLNRLLSLQEGSSEVNTCIICMNQCEDNPVVCNQCNQKLLNIKQDQAIDNTDNGSEEKSEKSVTSQEPKGISSDQTVAEDIVKEIQEAKIKVKKSKRKSIYKIVGAMVIVFLLIFYIVGSFDDTQDSSGSNSSTDINSSQKEQNSEPEKSGEDTVDHSENSILPPQQNNMDVVNSDQNSNIEGTVGDDKVNKDQGGISFNFTEEELMGQIQESLASYQLDIGTKEGYSNIYFVLEGDKASNVVYQIVLNQDLKVQTISINILAPVESLDVFSKAITSAIIQCDPTITYDEINSLIGMIGSEEIIRINDINYVAGPLSEDMLNFVITKAEMPVAMDKADNGGDNSDMGIRNEDGLEDINVEAQGYDMSALLGKTSEEVQIELGYPLDTVGNTEYYSDILSIVYENEVATKVILGLEERFDFTQIEIPQTIYNVDGIYLGTSKEAVLANSKDVRLFILDGMFYGSTYQTQQDGYYVNVDFFTLEDSEECPVYRVVITRLLPVE